MRAFAQLVEPLIVTGPTSPRRRRRTGDSTHDVLGVYLEIGDNSTVWNTATLCPHMGDGLARLRRISTNPQTGHRLLLDLYRNTIGLCAPTLPTSPPLESREMAHKAPLQNRGKPIFPQALFSVRSRAPRMPRACRKASLQRDNPAIAPPECRRDDSE